MDLVRKINNHLIKYHLQVKIVTEKVCANDVTFVGINNHKFMNFPPKYSRVSI